MNSRLLLLSGSATLLALAACADPTALPIRVPDPSLAVEAARRPGACPGLPKGTTSILLSPSAASIEVGASQPLRATNQDGVDLPACAVTWSVNPDAGVATISESGVVTGVSVGGPVTVSASVSSKGKKVLTALASITVRQAAVASVTLTPASSNLTIGATQQLAAELRDARGAVLTGRAITWSAGTPGVASVDASGLVTGVFLGQGATISATSEGVTGSAVVDVVPVPLASLSLVAAWWENGASRIYTMRGDGANPVYRETGISPSRIGNLMVARGGHFGENVIYAMDSTGANKRQIVGAGPSYVPDLSPDGLQLTLMYGDCPGGHPLAIASTNGSGVSAVNANFCTPMAPRWSPLGDRILFMTGGTLYTVKTDFTDQRFVASLTNGSGAVWAPNGTQVYVSAKYGTSTTYGIYRMDVDGTNVTPVLTGTGYDEFIVDVSPLGDWLVFYRNGEIWVATTTGASATRVVSNGAAQEGVRWVR